MPEKEFADEYIARGIKANAHYQGEYHLSTPIDRAFLAKKAVEIAQKEGITCIAHGCTGKGNDQVRIDGYVLALDKNMKIIAPVREWGMDREEEIKYAEKIKFRCLPASVFLIAMTTICGNYLGGRRNYRSETYRAGREIFNHIRFAERWSQYSRVGKIVFTKGIPIALNGKKNAFA